MATSPDILTGPDGNPFTPIEERHGDNCTCRPMGHVHVDLVAASRACAGDRNPHRGGTITAQLQKHEPAPYPGLGIVITWPASDGGVTPLLTWPMQVHDHTTGEPLLAITGLRMVLGGDQWNTEAIQVDINTCVDRDGLPLIGAPANVVPDPDDPERIYSRVFRCYVTEMRIVETAAETDAREQWEKLQQLGVKAGHMLRPDPDAVLTFTVPDDWTPEQHAELRRLTSARFPANEVVVYSESITLAVAPPTDPTVPTRESVNRGEHTIDQYRAHFGITDEYPVRMSRDPDDPSHVHQFAFHGPEGQRRPSPCPCGKTLDEVRAAGPPDPMQ